MSTNITELRIFAQEKLIELPDEIKTNTSSFVRFGKDKACFYKFKEINGHIKGVIGTWKGGKTCYTFQSYKQGPETSELDEAFTEKTLSESEEAEILHEEAASLARDLWESAHLCSENHPYLLKKGIPPIGIKAMGDQIIVPIRNGEGQIRAIQSIDAHGNKRFTTNGEVSGNFLVIEGKGRKAYVTEGFATGVSVYLATKSTVIIAFSSSAVCSVAQNVREKMPRKIIELAADCGEAGIKSAEDWKKKLKTHVHFPSSNKKENIDFNDLFTSKGEAAVAEKFRSHLPKVIDLISLRPSDCPDRTPIVTPFMLERSIGMVHSGAGAGKTLFTLGLCLHIAAGEKFLGWETAQKSVLYIDGEMELKDMVSRKDMLINGNELKNLVKFDILNRSVSPEYFYGTHKCEWKNMIVELAESYDIIVFDNISTIFGTKAGDENSATSWEEIKDFLFEIRFAGKCIIFIHHSTKGGKEQRGTSARVDTCDWVLGIEKLERKEACNLCIKGTFSKGRTGDMDSFGASWHIDGFWAAEDISNQEAKEILQMYEEDGLTIQQIERSMALPYSRVRKILKAQGIQIKKRGPRSQSE